MKLENYKNRNPFTTPEGYFAKLNNDIAKATCSSPTGPMKRKVRDISARMRWTSYAAIIAIMLTIGAGIASLSVDKHSTASEMSLRTSEEHGFEANMDNEFIDKMLESYPIDDYTFYCYLTDTENN